VSKKIKSLSTIYRKEKNKVKCSGKSGYGAEDPQKLVK
jgi:hypothetical protein